MKNTAQNTERKTYELKLKELLDEMIFFKDDREEEYTPRSYFEESFTQLLENPLEYFKKISKNTDEKEADEILKVFIATGGTAKSAYELIEKEICESIGFTLEPSNLDDEVTIEELLKDASPEMIQLIKRVILKDDHSLILTKNELLDITTTQDNSDNSKKFETHLHYAQNNYTSRVNADNLLSLEKGLLHSLKSVQESLECLWSAESTKTAREVYESGETE